jgi:hypothetical protein
MPLDKESNIPADVHQLFWDNSCPLDRAYWAFMNEETRHRFKRLELVGGSRAFNRNLARIIKEGNVTEYKLYPAKPTEGFWDATAAIAGVALEAMANAQPKRAQEYYDMMTTLQVQTLAWLREGQLLASGFTVPRRANDVPQLVPKDAFFGIVKWERNEVHHGSLKMEQVKVGLPKYWNTLLADFDIFERPEALALEAPQAASEILENSSPKNHRPPGRPSKRDLMWKAYQACLESGQIFFPTTKKHAHQMAMEWIVEYEPDQYDNGKGMRLDAFRKLIKQDFQIRSDQSKNSKNG